MIKNSFKVFLFLLMSVLEVRLHAAGFIDQPSGCFLKKQFPCAIKNLSLTQNISMNSVSLSPQGIIQWESGELITLVKGSVLIENKNITIASLYSSLNINGTSYVEYEDEMLKVEVYEGSSFVEKNNELGPGMLALIPGFNKQGKLIIEAPRPMNYDKSLKKWEQMSYARVSAEDKKKLKANIQNVVEVASKAYKNEVNRKVAAHKKNILDRRKRRLQKQKEIQKLNNLFKQKNYLAR